MAAIDKEIDETLRQLCQKLSQTDQCLDQLVQECDAQGAKVLQILKWAVEELKESQECFKGELFEWLTPILYQSSDGNIRNLDLSQVQEEVLQVIGTKGKAELMVGLVEDLEGFKKRGDEINERVIQLMTDFDIVPKCSGVKTKRISSFAEEVGKKKSDQGLKGKERGLSVSDIAIEMYGFPGDVAMHIEASLGHRKLIQNVSLFNMDEAQIIRLDEDSDEDADPFLQKTARERSWIRVKKLKRKFEELTKKIYKKQELDLKDSDNEDEDSLRIAFLRVIRNWIFHIESVLFDLIYELYHMLSGNQRAEAVFQEYRASMENLMQKNNRMLPITVYKIINMMKNPRELKNMVIRAPTFSGSDSRRFHNKMKLNDLMDLVLNVIFRLRLVLSTSGLSYAKTITVDESALFENMLEESEQEVRDIEGKVDWAKSEIHGISQWK